MYLVGDKMDSIIYNGENFSTTRTEKITDFGISADDVILTADSGYIFTDGKMEFKNDDGSVGISFPIYGFFSSENQRIIRIKLFDMKFYLREDLASYPIQEITLETEVGTVEGSDERGLSPLLDEHAKIDNRKRPTNWRDDNVAFTITTDKGYVIDRAVLSVYTARGSTTSWDLYETFNLDDETNILEFIPSEFFSRANVGEVTLNSKDYMIIEVTTIKGSTTDEPIPYKSNSFLRSYIADDDLLNDLSNLIYTGDAVQMNDLTSSIHKIYKIPFKIDEELIRDDKRKIYLGVYETPAESYLLDVSTLIYDFGGVEVPLIYNNLFDYKDTEAIIHLPFIEPIPVDIFKVIGGRVECILYLDVYTGEGTYIITSDKIEGNILFKRDVTVGYEIPILNKTNNMLINNLSRFTFDLDYLFKIEINRNIPLDNNKNYNLVYDKISNYGGNIKVEDLEIKSKATRSEKEEIKMILEQGIKI